MRRVLVLAAVGAVALSSSASAYLSSRSARLEAESTAYEVALRKAWAVNTKVGACHRLSTHRVSCDARVTGDEFKGCNVLESEGIPDGIACIYVFHSCQFTVAVHEAGYSDIGRMQDLKCTAREHTG